MTIEELYNQIEELISKAEDLVGALEDERDEIGAKGNEMTAEEIELYYTLDDQSKRVHEDCKYYLEQAQQAIEEWM